MTTQPPRQLPQSLLADITKRLRVEAHRLGFTGLGISGTDLSQAEQHLTEWLDAQYHGQMAWMAHHGTKRSRPEELVPGTRSIITVRMNYLPTPLREASELLERRDQAYIAQYALGRDYHKLLRKRLQRLAEWLEDTCGQLGYRAFCDSAPVLEKPLANKAGLGWIGKHSLLINRSHGSFFFLGEIYTDLQLPVTEQNDSPDLCGSCQRCISICPTQAIVAPYVLDARRCISYLTIEFRGSIPEPLRPFLGNRVFGCDDCQLVCPWNRYAKLSQESAFSARVSLKSRHLVDLFSWDRQTFQKNTEGSPIRRAGYEGFLRNVAIALGNAAPSSSAREALQSRIEDSSHLVREHVNWALSRHNKDH